MPTYEYQCLKCERVFEIRQRISEPALTKCDVCGGEVRRLLSAAPFILKGDGWDVTDYPSESRKKAVESEKNSAKAPAADKATSTDSAPSKRSDSSTGPKEGAGAGDGATAGSAAGATPGAPAKPPTPAAPPATKTDCPPPGPRAPPHEGGRRAPPARSFRGAARSR